MAAKKPAQERKYFTVEQANRTLPLVRSIIRDVTELASDLRDRYERLSRYQNSQGGSAAHDEELEQMQAEFQRDQERMHEYEAELRHLGVELKDYFTGLIDFPCWMDNREVYLCWKLGEQEVGYWHEIEAGFAGRQKLPKTAARPLAGPQGAGLGG
jgi:hypothetical protein